MNTSASLALFFIASIAISTGAHGKNVYRCGNSYSEKPCAEGVSVNVTDTRTPTQRAQSDAMIRRDATAAKASDKERTKDEAARRADETGSATTSARKTSAKPKLNAEPASSVGTPASDTKASKKAAKKKTEPEFFTAQSIVAKPAPRASSSK